MKPSYTDYIDFTINNVGTNPADVWKTLANVNTSDNVQSEPECVAEQGTWNGTVCSPRSVPKDDIDTVIGYDLSVELLDATGASVWIQRLYNDDVKVSAIKGGTKKMYLGMIPEGYSMKVHQSYHMDATAGNEYQGDQMTFDIVLDAEQLLGGTRGASVVLENKEGAAYDINEGDVYKGTLSYTVMDPKFDFSFTGKVKQANTNYTLLAVKDPWPQTGSVVLGTANSDGTGAISFSGTPDINQNLVNHKVWLIPSSHWSGTQFIRWDQGAYLFETGLIEYRDTDLP